MMRNMKVLIQNYEVNTFIVTDKASQIHLTSSSVHKKRTLCSAQMYFNHSVGPSNVNTIFLTLHSVKLASLRTQICYKV